MGKRRSSPSSSSSSASSDRRQWQRIFKALVEMLQSQQSQIETLADERKHLEKYIHIQDHYWSSKILFFESHIAQLKKEEAKGRKIQAATIDLAVEMKKREALCYKKQYELAESDLEDFHACVKALNVELLQMKEKQKSEGVGVSGHMEQCTTALEVERKKLKRSYKKLSSEKEVELSGVLKERDFSWNKLKDMESYYSAIISSKKLEAEHANEIIEKLQHSLKEMQMSVNKKDEMMAELKANHVLEMRRCTQEAKQSNEKIEQLVFDKEELRSLAKEKDNTIANLRSKLAKVEMEVCHRTRKSRVPSECEENASRTPSESDPRKGSRKRKSESSKQGRAQKHRSAYDDSSGSQPSISFPGLVRCSSKRITRSNSSTERPVLFHSNFKVPKLKSSPLVGE